MAAITKRRLVEDLTALGVRRGDCVMLHSSLSSLGYVEGGAATVVDAFLEAMGETGDLVVPSFRDSLWTGRFGFEACKECSGQDVCSSTEPGIQGAIPEEVRKRPESLRSCHPTHSWSAIGPHAYDIVKDHRLSPTPCGKGNPFEKVLDLDGCVVILGVGVNTITLWHYYEDILKVPYLGKYHPEQRHLSYCTAGLRIQYEFPGIMHDVARASGIMRTGPVGKSTSGLIRARAFEKFLATIMADDPFCFTVRPPDRESDDLAVDALRKAERMLAAWRRGPAPLPGQINWPEDDPNLVREDCAAFAGWHSGGSKVYPLCKANGRHPDLFRLGGVFNDYGLTSCARCSWNLRFPSGE